jgi:hypothetical protein
MSAPAERRSKARRKQRKLVGSPPREAARIDVNEEYELHFWSKELGINPDELKAAVQKVGSSVKAVREHLGK